MTCYCTVVLTRKFIHPGGFKKHHSPNLQLGDSVADISRNRSLEPVGQGQILVTALQMMGDLIKLCHLCALLLPAL